MAFKKEIVAYMANNPKTQTVFIHNKTGVHFFNQPTVTKMKMVKDGANEKQVKEFEADKNYKEFSREEVLSGAVASTESPYKKMKDADLIALCVERQYPEDEYKGKKGNELKSYLDEKDAAE